MRKFFLVLKRPSVLYYRLYSIIKSNCLKSYGVHALISDPIYIHNGKLISVGKNFHSEKRVRLEAFDIQEYQDYRIKIVIGDNVHLNWDCHIGAINRIEIGDNVLIGSKVLITDHSHGNPNNSDISLPPNKRPLYSKGPVIIKNNVWIGEGVAILPNVTIGENSIIGANSVVTKDIPANVIAVGNPARIIRENWNNK